MSSLTLGCPISVRSIAPAVTGGGSATSPSTCAPPVQVAKGLLAPGPNPQAEMKILPFNPPARGVTAKAAQVAIAETGVMRTVFSATGVIAAGTAVVADIRPTPNPPPAALESGKPSAADLGSSLTPSSAARPPCQSR